MITELGQEAKGRLEIGPHPSQEIARLGFLKQRLVLRRLDETPDPESHALIIREADQAARLALRTTFPLLVFPCLFEEMADAALEQQQRWSAEYWDWLAPAAAVVGRATPRPAVLGMSA